MALRLVAGAAAAGALGAIVLPAAAQDDRPGPLQVIGYATPDRAGPSKTWELPAEAPYLYVPFVGADVDGLIAAVETGAQVGVALFQRPFFATRDVGCTPALGTDARPDLRWLGATARFEPSPPQQPSGPEVDPGAAQGGYASLIVYRRELGPPPGVLLLDRRSTMGVRCRNPIHKTVYNRVFVPIAPAPDATRCFDLSGAYRYQDSEELVLQFTTSDRLVLLMPSDLDPRYANVQHDLTAVLYEGLGCQGGAVSFRSGASTGRDVRLDGFDFRDRTRSVRVTYENGVLAAYFVRRPAPAPVAEPAEPPAQREAPPARPAVAASQAPAPAPVAAPPSPAPPSPALPPAEPAAPAVQRSPGSEPTAAAEPAPKAEPEPSPRAVQQALPKLQPVMPPAAGAAAPPDVPDKTFAFPVHEIYRLNYCLYWGKDCGEAAAAAWCKTQGFQRAAAWKIDENIGGLFPTIVMGEDRVCAQFVCDGFREITCAR